MPLDTRAPAPVVRRARRWIYRLAAIAGFLALLLAVRTWVMEPFRIASPSMEPTLLAEGPDRAGDTILVHRLAYVFSDPARWEVVVFRPVDSGDPANGGRNIVKRVVGLPGETIEIDGGEVFVDGQPLLRPLALQGIRYVRSGSFGQGPVRLGPGQYFVLGDNSYPSVDSRRFGPLPRENLVGRAVWIVWPTARAGRIP